jgi:DNA excision repair protein ERCC-4
MSPIDIVIIYSYLLSYDALAFHAYLETVVQANTISATGASRVNQSPWLLTEAADTIFRVAKRRCFTITTLSTEKIIPVIDVDDEEEAWAALDELDTAHRTNKSKEKDIRPTWLPKSVQPTLEEQPKWDLLSDILLEIETETIRFQSNFKPGTIPGTDTVLIMTSSTKNCDLIQEFLDNMDTEAVSGRKGARMMQKRLRTYLFWRGKLEKDLSGDSSSSANASSTNMGGSGKGKERERDSGVNEALRKKDKERAEKSARRRRVRGGAPSGGSTRNAGDATNANGSQGNEIIDVDKVDDDIMTL